jgi:hypothetical protein
LKELVSSAAKSEQLEIETSGVEVAVRDLKANTITNHD